FLTGKGSQHGSGGNSAGPTLEMFPATTSPLWKGVGCLLFSFLAIGLYSVHIDYKQISSICQSKQALKLKMVEQDAAGHADIEGLRLAPEGDLHVKTGAVKQLGGDTLSLIAHDKGQFLPRSDVCAVKI